MTFVSVSPPFQRPRHRPVMPREVLRALELFPGAVVVDGTVGAAGHSREIVAQIGPNGRLLGIDRDPAMLALAAQRLHETKTKLESAELVQGSYADLREILDQRGCPHVDRILLDLGLSSDQLADESRGFGFGADGPLDLRFDTSTGEPAFAWLATAHREEIQEVLETYGEEPHSGAIAKRLSERVGQLGTITGRELAELVDEAIGRRGRSSQRGPHPARRVFQALRIKVNSELDQLHRMLSEVLPDCLPPGGKAVIITFHSLEDRMVKHAFRDQANWENPAKPIAPTPSEVRMNPRARSARLRTARRRTNEPTDPPQR